MSFAYDPLHFALQKDLRWSSPRNFDFLEAKAFLPVFPAELRRLAGVLPLAVRRLGERLTPVALVGDDWAIQPMLDGDGAWMARLMPQALLVHPFRLVEDSAAAGPVVMVARDARCVGKEGANSFFSEHGSLSEPAERMLRRLRLLQASRGALDAAARRLFEKGLLMPLPEPATDVVRKPVARARETFLTLDPEAFDGLSATELDGEADGGAFVLRLAVALRVSHQHLPAPILMRLRPAVKPGELTRSVLDLFAKTRRTDALPKPDVEPADDSLRFLVDEEAVLRFDFTASGSVFDRG